MINSQILIYQSPTGLSAACLSACLLLHRLIERRLVTSAQAGAIKIDVRFKKATCKDYLQVQTRATA